MSSRKYQLNADNWVLFFNETVPNPNSLPVPKKNWTFSPSLQSEAELLAIYAETPSGKDSWQWAGYLNLSFPTGLIVGGVVDAESAVSRSIEFNKIILFEVNKFSSSYGIEMSVYHWVPDITLIIWEYTGLITTPELELLKQINEKI